MKSRGYLTLIISLFLSLLLLGVLTYGIVLANKHGARALDRVISPVALSVVLTDTVTSADLAAIEKLIRAQKEVDRVLYVSSADAQQEFSRALGMKPQMDIGLPASFEVYYHGGSAAAGRLLTAFSSQRAVRETLCDPSLASARQRLIDQITKVVKIVIGALGVVILVLLFVIVWAWVQRNKKMVAIVPSALIAGVAAGVSSAVVLIALDQYLYALMPTLALDLGVSLLLGSLMVMGGVAVAVLFSYMSIKSQKQ
ncbi:MAG: permease-like cell division protein FtsX [Mucinivorans sp.]